ncbi:MAG: hypothetical protein IPM16_04730 [Chloroflexi bacterium]|nr:hypothetical protein [Chloroflexota bacterium]
MSYITTSDRRIIEELLAQYDIAVLQPASDQRREDAARVFLGMLHGSVAISESAQVWLWEQVESAHPRLCNPCLRILLEMDSRLPPTSGLSHDFKRLRALSLSRTNLFEMWRRYPPPPETVEEIIRHRTWACDILLEVEAVTHFDRFRELSSLALSPLTDLWLIDSLVPVWYHGRAVELLEAAIDGVQHGNYKSDGYTCSVLARSVAYVSLLARPEPDARLRTMSDDENPIVAGHARVALAMLGDPKVVHKISETRLDMADTDTEIMLNAAYFLGSPICIPMLFDVAKQGPLIDDMGETLCSTAAFVIEAITGIRIRSTDNSELIVSRVEEIQSMIPQLGDDRRYYRGHPLNALHFRSRLSPFGGLESSAGYWGLLSTIGIDVGYRQRYDVIHNLPALDKWDEIAATWDSNHEPGRWYFKGKLVR